MDKREKIVGIITAQLDRFLRSRRSTVAHASGVQKVVNIIFCRCLGRRFSGYLLVLFLFTKVLYIINVISQLFVLNSIFQTSYNFFGVEFFLNSQNEEYVANSPVFPRVTMCDFLIRIVGNVQRYTVQCVLPINLYTEKIYVFLWFWFVLVATCSSASLFMWVIRAVLRKDRHMFILNHIPLRAVEDRLDGEPMSKTFVNEYLKQDGTFLLRLMAHNTNHVTTTKIISNLYEHWRDKVKDRGHSNDEETDGEDEITGHLL